MEQYGLIRELQALATANDWKFILGTDDYANIEADFHCEVGQLVLWVQMTPNPVRNDGNRISEINYTGAIALLGKFDSDNINRAQLDETWKQKYDRRLEDIQKLFSDKMKTFACSNQLQIESDTYEYVINIFDTNLDGVEGTFTINQDRFSDQVTDYDLEIVAEEGGSVLPYEGIQSFAKYSQVALAAFADDNYNFDKWEFLINGATTEKASPSLIANIVNNIIATAKFIATFSQWVFNTTIVKMADKYYFPDSTANNKNVEINNTQVGNFNGSVYLQFTDLTGIAIASYESDGSAVPTKAGNTITVTAGLLYSITLDNGMVGYFNEELKDEIFFSDQNGNVLIVTLENVVLATFWNTKSEFGTCGTVINGYSKYLVCETAGTTATLADPKGENLGVEKVVNGDFDTDSDWSKGAGWTISGGTASRAGQATYSSLIQNLDVTIDSICLIKIDVISIDSGVLRIYLGNNYSTYYVIDSAGHYEFYATVYGAPILTVQGYTSEVNVTIDNILVKEVTSIPVINIYKFQVKVAGISDTYFISDSADISGNGYLLRTNATDLTLYRNDSGSLVQLDTIALSILPTDKIECNVNISGININVNDVQKLTTTDTAYTTTKFITLDYDSGCEISHIESDGKYDVDNFSDGTGTYGVQKIQAQTTLLDCKGNELEIPANVVSNSGNTFKGILADGLELVDATYEQVYDIVTDANTEITKTPEKSMGNVSQLKELS
jgi:hypothetical protein